MGKSTCLMGISPMFKWENHIFYMGKITINVVNFYITNWKFTMFNGKTQYTWAMFNSYVELLEI